MKSHFVFTKEQRNGIFLLLLIIIALQCMYFFIDFSSDALEIDKEELKRYEAEIDALRQMAIKEHATKIYPFNPNYITDYKGSILGMSNAEIDRLLAFRKKDKWINSAQQFQEVTGVSDVLLEKISPYFKFPDWVSNPDRASRNYPLDDFREEARRHKGDRNNKPLTYPQKRDLNTATASQLEKTYGIGSKLAQRVITYRERLGGFIADIELHEVYGLSPEVIENIKSQFTVKTPRATQTVNINIASVDELVLIKYIDYEIAHSIIEYRKLHEGFSSLNELLKVKDFPINKFEIIKLSLSIH
ncbi:helix-hairpin-helix domain-containing protein [Flavobacteriaceae bacterium MHTCC 0001]